MKKIKMIGKPFFAAFCLMTSLLLVSNSAPFFESDKRSPDVNTQVVDNIATLECEINQRVPTFYVSLPNPQVGYTLVAKSGSYTNVTYNGSFTFVFTLLPSYDQSSPVIKVNNHEVSIDLNGEGTISNIVENKTITVEGVEINKYSVSVPSNQVGYSLAAKSGSEYTVDYGESFTFVFSLLEGYTQSLPRILVNGVEVTLDVNNECIVADIDENITIIVENVALNTYTITWNIEGQTSTTVVNHGDTPIYEGTPSKPSTDTHAYVFDHWTPEIVAAVGNATYTAVFEERAIKIGATDPDESAGEVEAELSVPGGVIIDAVLKVKIVETTDGDISVPDNKEIFKLYNATLLNSENEDISASITGEVTLKFAMPSGLEEREGIQIVIDGESVARSVMIEGQFIVFETESLGDFALVVDTQSNTNLSLIVTLSVAGFVLLIFAGFGVFFLVRKKDKEKDDTKKEQRSH